MGSNLGSGRNWRWGEWITSVVSTLNSTTEVRPLSKAPNPRLLPGRRCIGCPLLRVCVHYCVCALGLIKCRAQILSIGLHTWLCVTSNLVAKIKAKFKLIAKLQHADSKSYRHIFKPFLFKKKSKLSNTFFQLIKPSVYTAFETSAIKKPHSNLNIFKQSLFAALEPILELTAHSF